MQDTIGCMPAAQKPQLFVGAGWVSYESRAELQHSLGRDWWGGLQVTDSDGPRTA